MAQSRPAAVARSCLEFPEGVYSQETTEVVERSGPHRNSCLMGYYSMAMSRHVALTLYPVDKDWDWMFLNKRVRSQSYVPSALPQRVRQHGDHSYYKMADWE